MKNTPSSPTQKSVEETDNKQLILRELYKDTTVEVVGKLNDDDETYTWFAALAGNRITEPLVSKEAVIAKLDQISIDILVPVIAIVTEAIIKQKEIENGNN